MRLVLHSVYVRVQISGAAVSLPLLLTILVDEPLCPAVPCTPGMCLQVAGRVALSYGQSDFAHAISEPGPGVADLCLSAADLDMFLDLGPFVNPSYYVVQVRHIAFHC